MKRIVSLLCALLLVTGCASSTVTVTEKENPPLQNGEITRVTTKVSASPIRGVETTVRVARVRDKATGAEMPPQVDVFETPNTGGDLAKIATGSVAPAVVQGAFGLAIAKQNSCKGGNCGTQIYVDGAEAGALAGAQTDVTADVDVSSQQGSCSIGKCAKW